MSGYGEGHVAPLPDALVHLDQIYQSVRQQVIAWGDEARWKIDLVRLDDAGQPKTTPQDLLSPKLEDIPHEWDWVNGFTDQDIARVQHLDHAKDMSAKASDEKDVEFTMLRRDNEVLQQKLKNQEALEEEIKQIKVDGVTEADVRRFVDVRRLQRMLRESETRLHEKNEQIDYLQRQLMRSSARHAYLETTSDNFRQTSFSLDNYASTYADPETPKTPPPIIPTKRKQSISSPTPPPRRPAPPIAQPRSGLDSLVLLADQVINTSANSNAQRNDEGDTEKFADSSSKGRMPSTILRFSEKFDLTHQSPTPSPVLATFPAKREPQDKNQRKFRVQVGESHSKRKAESEGAAFHDGDNKGRGSSWKQGASQETIRLIDPSEIEARGGIENMMYKTPQGKTANTSSFQFKKSRSPYVKWTREEDALLREAVAKYGADNWNLVARSVPGRTYHQCRQRWVKVLKHGTVMRALYSPDEERGDPAATDKGSANPKTEIALQALKARMDGKEATDDEKQNEHGDHDCEPLDALPRTHEAAVAEAPLENRPSAAIPTTPPRSNTRNVEHQPTPDSAPYNSNSHASAHFPTVTHAIDPSSAPKSNKISLHQEITPVSNRRQPAPATGIYYPGPNTPDSTPTHRKDRPIDRYPSHIPEEVDELESDDESWSNGRNAYPIPIRWPKSEDVNDAEDPVAPMP
ncbi:hypothetical protein BZG36_04645 [Bifiguratus adelaidae]|uniref:Uncharacterized protein n=1 Tax=Bifiguratus adelaidae TaxID=1938954 RepID=A0A261XXP7_9FUNG|nr:hypothetical protein BZG36_04645 [Bifiguratus adelaidae]